MTSVGYVIFVYHIVNIYTYIPHIHTASSNDTLQHYYIGKKKNDRFHTLEIQDTPKEKKKDYMFKKKVT